MGRLRSTAARRMLRVLALSAIAIGGLATWALATGPGGWDHLGDRGTPGTRSLDYVARALKQGPGGLYVGGEFFDAGGMANADRIARWNGSSWSALSSTPASQISNGGVFAIAVTSDKLYVGGTFTNAGGNPDADFVAAWNGATWEAPCDDTDALSTTSAIGGNVTALQIVGQTLYVGGEFDDGAHLPAADSLLACDLATGAPTATTLDPLGVDNFSGPVYALTADSNGTLYAGGGFTDLENIPAADNVAYKTLGGTWQNMGAGGPPCDCAVTTFVRGLTAVGTDVYVGTDANDIGGLAKADHVAKWNASGWSALGSNSAGTDGWFPTSAEIDALTGTGSNLFVGGSFQNANGDPRADNVAFFDGSAWHPVGSNGAGDGPLNSKALALAIVDRRLYAAGNFTSAGGDTLAWSAASFDLAQVIAYPTPTVTPGPSAVPTPTVTPSPTTAPPPDTTAPRTLLRKAQINQAKRRATFRFASGEAGSRFVCKLDKKPYKPCTSPKTYKKLKRGKHVFRVKARDRTGNVDRTPVVKRFKIKR
ncbi:MAG: hypothetical protein QOC68_167 [Solirubrobacteraceae bacterium]|nr:hypothetical protein [Solirubrobacteraceae bacterium]